MKFIHLSDLHLGKRISGFSMIEEQEYILEQIIGIIDEEKPDTILIAGDVYDRSVPPVEAVKLLENFLYALSNRKAEVFIISGNHDSPERLAFCSQLIDISGIHISPVYDGEVKPFAFNDSFGQVNIYMLPFIRPSSVRNYFEDREIITYEDAVRAVVEKMNVNISDRNILVAHQFVTGASRTDSEEVSVGGIDDVDSSIFDDFDYVALGHIHRPQNCGSKRIRYCGTPLKYSFSEVNDRKSVTVGEIGEKGSLELRAIRLVPKHNMSEIRGTYNEITEKSFYQDTAYQEDYLHITLTDEEEIPDAVIKLRTIYHRIMKLDYDNVRTRNNAVIKSVRDIESKTPLELFEDFYYLQNGTAMNEEQRNYMEQIIERIWGIRK